MHTNPVAVIATYNEADTIPVILHKLRIPAIVVDDNSRDKTGVLAESCGAEVIHRPWKMGIASAYVTGMKHALDRGYDPIVQMDAGGTHRPEDAHSMLRHAKAWYCDLVIGSRFKGGYEPQGYRTLISRGAAVLMALADVYVEDATSGFRVWRSNLLQEVLSKPVKSEGFAFQLELLYRAACADRVTRIYEFPIEYRLTNSSFRPSMVLEALRVWGGIYVDHIRNHS